MVVAAPKPLAKKRQSAPKSNSIQPQMVQKSAGSPPLRKFSLDEYHHLVQTDFFQPDERIELINGYLVMMSPLNPPHAAATTLLGSQFYDLVAKQCTIRIQQPIVLTGQTSEPEPDIVLAKPKLNAYARQHPHAADILLLVEVSDSTLCYARTAKKRMYALAVISEYWIMNLVDEKIEAYRDPSVSATGRAEYQTRLTYAHNQTITPLAFPDCSLDLSQVFPSQENE